MPALNAMFTAGEGGVSRGAMVPVYDARDPGRASQVVALLEAHAIPAILDSELAGVPGIPRHEIPRVLVPSSMLSLARAVLLEHQGASTPDPRQLSALLTWVPAKVVDPPPLGGQPALPATVEEAVYEEPEEDTQPIEPHLPASGPVLPRLSLALGAVGFGVAFQRVLEGLLGPDGVSRAFGATQAVLTEPWRLVTAGFVHGSFSHMLSNAAFGVVLGVVLFGTHRLGATALVWLLSSFVGLGAEALLSPGTVVIGASAGNYGLVGLWACGQLQRARRSVLPRRERLRTLGVLMLLLPGALTPFNGSGTRIAVLAHVFGFLAGLALGVFFGRRVELDRLARIRFRAAVAGGVALALSTLGFAVALAVAWARNQG